MSAARSAVQKRFHKEASVPSKMNSLVATYLLFTKVAEIAKL
jgi:hypothetical protein